MGKRCANILNGLRKDIYFNAELTGSQFLLCALKESIEYLLYIPKQRYCSAFPYLTTWQNTNQSYILTS